MYWFKDTPGENILLGVLSVIFSVPIFILGLLLNWAIALLGVGLLLAGAIIIHDTINPPPSGDGT